MIACPHCKKSIGQAPVDAEAARLVKLYKAKGPDAAQRAFTALGLRQSDLVVLRERFHNLLRAEL